MKAKVFFILLLPMTALGEPCLPQSTDICTPDSGKKQAILDAIRDAGKKELARQAAFDDWRKASTNRETLDAMERVKRFDKEMKDDYKEAIDLTQQAYHISLPKTEGPIVKPHYPEGLGDWSIGIQATWNPTFSEKEEPFLHAKGNDGEYHHMGGKIPKDTGGATYPDGSVLIMKNILDNALAAGNPGYLAYIIHHEANHFGELLSRGWDSYEENEARTYQKSIAASETFELDKIVIGKNGETAKDMVKGQFQENAKALAAGRRTSLYPDAQAEEKNRQGFIDQKKVNENFEKMLIQLRNDVAEEERRQKEEAALKRKEEAQRRTMEEYAAEVSWHRFRELRRDANGLSRGFKFVYDAGGGVEADAEEFRFTSSMDLEAAKMAMYFADLCLSGGYAPSSEGHLTEVVRVIDQRWSDEIFRSKLELWTTSGRQDECLRYMRDNASPPITFKSMNKMVARFLKDWKANQIRRQNEQERADRRREEEQNRQTRERPTGNRGDDGRERVCSQPNSSTGIIGCPAPNPP